MKTVVLIVLLSIALLALFSRLGAFGDQVNLREEMVRNQIEARGVSNQRVLDAMRKVPRERFVPLPWRALAYEDRPLPIGEDQTISQPYIVALMTERLELPPTARVLEIGTGSGYQAAVLAELTREVYTIEIIPALADRARKVLTELGYKNVFVKTGDGYLGWPDKAPFDGIIVTCAPESVPKPLVDQLKQGGKMVIPVGPQGTVQRLVLLEKDKDKLAERTIEDVLFVPMLRNRPPDPAPSPSPPAGPTPPPGSPSPGPGGSPR